LLSLRPKKFDDRDRSGELVKARQSFNRASCNWVGDRPGFRTSHSPGFEKTAVIDMVYVPYRDFTPATSDLDEGRIDIASTALTQMLPHEQAGHAKLLAVMNGPASPAAPHVPTAMEVRAFRT